MWLLLQSHCFRADDRFICRTLLRMKSTKLDFARPMMLSRPPDLGPRRSARLRLHSRTAPSTLIT